MRIAVARYVNGFESVLDGVRHDPGRAVLEDDRVARDRLLLLLGLRACQVQRDELAVHGGEEVRAVGRADAVVDVGLREAVGDESLLAVLLELQGDDGIELAVNRDDRVAGADRGRPIGDVNVASTPAAPTGGRRLMLVRSRRRAG